MMRSANFSLPSVGDLRFWLTLVATTYLLSVAVGVVATALK
jgi:hypothetical protein